MRKTALLCCWKFFCFFWTFALNILMRKMCFTYEIQVPDDYSALGGDLEVHVIGLVRTFSENVRLELLEINYVESEKKKSQKRNVNVFGRDFDSKTFKKSSQNTGTLPPPSLPSSLSLAHSHDSAEFKSNQNHSEWLKETEKSATNDVFETKKPFFEFLSRVMATDESQVPNVKIDKKWTVLQSLELPKTLEGELNVVKVQFPCGVISRGGRFGVRLTGHNETINSLTNKPKNQRFYKLNDSKLAQIETNSIVELDVRWPHSVLSLTPHHVETYPEEPVTALLQFLPTKCSPAKDVQVPETWLDLIFCGHSLFGCTEKNSTLHQVVYSEQIRGYPEAKSISLQCELFGSAGYFTLALRSLTGTTPIMGADSKNAYLKVVWSKHYVFNVHARSIFPCDVHGGGVSVLFQYPKCVLKGDRIRLFSRLRADVSSIIPPTTLHYVTEQRVVKGKHSLKFDCDYFSEKFIEYCFVYVSQAITGAVSDVRMDCVPTMPLYDSDSGNWGSWNAWSECTSTCGGGTRNRFRYCDSPPPKYGAKFCEGPSIETERCGNPGEWDCEFFRKLILLDSKDTDSKLSVNKPEILAEVGPGCRCGCVVHLGITKPRRLLATSSQSCPGRIFWQIEADKEHVIKFSVEYFRFPCGSQWLKIRDGDSRSSTLIGEISGSSSISVPIVSSGSKLLIEFFSDELLANGQDCWGGFLAHAQQSRKNFANNTFIGSGFSFSNILRSMEVVPTASTSFFLIHSFIALFLCLIILISTCLGIQYVFRYRKYQLASAAEDAESMGGDSQSSLIDARNRVNSNSTLLSEVISLKKFYPVKKFKHTRLKKEDVDLEEEHLSESSESQMLEGIKVSTSSLKTLKAENINECVRTSPPPRRKKLYCSSRRSSTFEDISNNLAADGLLKKYRKIGRSISPENTNASTSSLEGPHFKRRIQFQRILQYRRGSLSTSSGKSESTLANDDNSPASSATSISIRNSKAKKERKNLKKLLAESEFNLSEGGDLELDYYDYNVQNASAVPESYIGMDPAYLVWIPPFSPVEWEKKETEKEEEIMEELEQKKNYLEKKETTVDLISVDIKENKRKGVDKVNNRCLYQLSDLSNEKETRMEKSPSQSSDYYRVIVDIRFADDDEEDIKMENSKCDSPLIHEKLEEGLTTNDKNSKNGNKY